MRKRLIHPFFFVVCFCLGIISCKVPSVVQTTENKSVPQSYNQLQDTASATTLHWTKFFADPNLQNLIDTALRRNQELNITWKEIELARNEIRFKDAALFPTVGAGVGLGLEKVGRYTSQGA